MKQLLYLALFAIVLVSCKKDKPDPDPDPIDPAGQTTLRIKINAFYENEPLVFGQTYHNISNYRVNVTDLRMYLAHIYGVRSGGETVSFSDIEFANLTNGEVTLSLGTVPSGNYSEFGFGLGVPEEMNSPANPNFSIAVFSSDHPLSQNNGMYWTWQTGYRFVIFDGKYDTDPDGTGLLIPGYSFHTGKDESYRNVVFPNASFTVEANKQNTVYLDLHVDRFYYSETDTIDLAVHNQSHGSNQELSDRVSDIITQAISFRE